MGGRGGITAGLCTLANSAAASATSVAGCRLAFSHSRQLCFGKLHPGSCGRLTRSSRHSRKRKGRNRQRRTDVVKRRSLGVGVGKQLSERHPTGQQQSQWGIGSIGQTARLFAHFDRAITAQFSISSRHSTTRRRPTSFQFVAATFRKTELVTLALRRNLHRCRSAGVQINQRDLRKLQRRQRTDHRQKRRLANLRRTDERTAHSLAQIIENAAQQLSSSNKTAADP